MAQPSREPHDSEALVYSSMALGWQSIVVEQFRLPPAEVEIAPRPVHTFCFNTGAPHQLVQARAGRVHESWHLPGEVTLTPAGLAQRWRWDGVAEILHLRLAAGFVHRIAEEAAVGNPDRIEVVNNFGTHDPQIVQLGLALVDELRTRGLAGTLYAESLATVLAIHLLRQYCSCTPRAQPVPGRMAERDLQRVIAYIDANLDRDLSLRELAHLTGLSMNHFAVLFKRSNGVAPHRYVIQQRVARAQQLLQHAELPISAVAQQVGFADQAHLTHHFKRIVGVTPAVYRRHR